MSLGALFVIAVGLSMDACAVAICKGLSVGKVRPHHALTCGVYFGAFQGLMPLLGWLLGVRFQDMIVSIDHWIAFVLLGLIGVNMIRESRGEAECLDDSFSAKAMFPLAIADSIDALAVGVTFAFMEVPILSAVLLIGVTTFVFSAAGIRIGNRFGSKYKAKAELTGGAILILMGILILIEDLGIL